MWQIFDEDCGALTGKMHPYLTYVPPLLQYFWKVEMKGMYKFSGLEISHRDENTSSGITVKKQTNTYLKVVTLPQQTPIVFIATSGMWM